MKDSDFVVAVDYKKLIILMDISSSAGRIKLGDSDSDLALLDCRKETR